MFGISAAYANLITTAARSPEDPWEKLFKRIMQEAKRGQSMLVFDEEVESVKFVEHRKDVKKKLEDLGYCVSYSRIKDTDNYIDAFHNRYVIEW